MDEVRSNRYAGIIENDIVDCLHGVAVSFWVQGCPFQCKGCHNPKTWSPHGGSELPPDWLDRIHAALNKNGVQRHLAILGGEPLFSRKDFSNIALTYELVKAARSWKDFKGDIYLWTGFPLKIIKHMAFLRAFKKIRYILKNVTYLVDGRYCKERRSLSLPLRGSDNQNLYKRTWYGFKKVTSDSLRKNKEILKKELTFI